MHPWYCIQSSLMLPESCGSSDMSIKDWLMLQGTTNKAADKIEYNTMGAFQTINCNTHEYYIVKWTGNAYTLQGKYKCHAFDTPVIILEG